MRSEFTFAIIFNILFPDPIWSEGNHESKIASDVRGRSFVKHQVGGTTWMKHRCEEILFINLLIYKKKWYL